VFRVLAMAVVREHFFGKGFFSSPGEMFGWPIDFLENMVLQYVVPVPEQSGTVAVQVRQGSGATSRELGHVHAKPHVYSPWRGGTGNSLGKE